MKRVIRHFFFSLNSGGKCLSAKYCLFTSCSHCLTTAGEQGVCWCVGAVSCCRLKQSRWEMTYNRLPGQCQWPGEWQRSLPGSLWAACKDSDWIHASAWTWTLHRGLVDQDQTYADRWLRWRTLLPSDKIRTHRNDIEMSAVLGFQPYFTSMALISQVVVDAPRR